MAGKKPFTDMLVSLRWGTLHDDLTQELNELVKKCSDTGKVGTLSLTLKLKPGSGGQIEVIDDIKVTAPKETKGTSIMFATVENNLVREDPRQQSIEGLRSVDMTTGELKKVG